MTDVAIERMTTDEFFVWQASQDERYEFIDGRPRAMTGASLRHDIITVNIISELRRQLKGRPCRAASADVAVRLPSHNIRRPDALVECSPRIDGTIAHEPVVAIEVLSPSTRVIDQTTKFVDYKTIVSLAYYVLVQQEHPEITLYRRQSDGVWAIEIVTGLDGVITFETLDVTLPLAEIYDRLTFEVPAGGDFNATG